MLDAKTATIVKEAIDEFFETRRFGQVHSMEDIIRMNKVTKVGRGGPRIVLAGQFEWETIMVWIEVSEIGDITVKNVKVVEW